MVGLEGQKTCCDGISIRINPGERYTSTREMFNSENETKTDVLCIESVRENIIVCM